MSEPLEGEVIPPGEPRPGNVVLLPAKRRGPQLTTLHGVRYELRRLYRRVDRGELKSDDAERRSKILRSILESIALDRYYKDIASMREQLEGRQ
jgi:hypothetical protein